MNNKNEDFFNSDIETNVSEEEIILAPPVELFDEAKAIAHTTVEDEKFPFMLHYNANQKEHLLSMLGTVGAIVEDDDDDGHVLATMMNMTQLAFIKRLDCVERVRTHEGRNTMLAAEATKANTADHSATEATATHQAAQVMTLAVEESDDSAAHQAAVASEDVAVASSSCCCPSNTSMATAQNVAVEIGVSGNICCPGAEQWFKFTAPATKQYTIFTTGALDTIGTLYSESGNQIDEVDDYKPLGLVNFRIIRNLTAGNTYYIKVREKKGNTGSYTLKITGSVLANSVSVNKTTIVLEKGVTYELPITSTSNYRYKGYNGAQQIPGLVVTLNPSDASNQEIWWYELSNILQCSYGWDNDGDRYIHVTATETGTAKLYAVDWNEEGKGEELEIIEWEQYKADQTEYHLIPQANLGKALYVQGYNTTRLSSDTDVMLKPYSFINREKWLIKNADGYKQLYNQHGDGFRLCKKDNSVIVSKNSALESHLIITPYNNSSSLVEIKLANSNNLYLTVSGSNVVWESYNATNHNTQVWELKCIPSYLCNGCDTANSLTETTVKELRLGCEKFVCRYYSRDENAWKRLTQAEVDYLHSNGIDIVSIYQDAGNTLNYFTVQRGKDDATRALALANSFNQKKEESAIYFAAEVIDAENDTNISIDNIIEYFKAVKEVIGDAYKIGVYGGKRICEALKPQYVDYSFLNAWGNYSDYDSPDDDHYNIKQAEPIFYNGTEFDDNTAVGTNFGQW